MAVGGKKPPFQIHATFSVHDEGTKFYQVIRVITPLKCMVINHWGKFSDSVTSLDPHGGQTQTFPAVNERSAEAMAATTVKKKSARGYGGWRSKSTQEMKSLTEFTAVCRKGFSTTDFHAIESHILTGEIDLEMPAVTDQVDDDAPMLTKKGKKIPEPERGDSWGSW